MLIATISYNKFVIIQLQCEAKQLQIEAASSCKQSSKIWQSRNIYFNFLSAEGIDTRGVTRLDGARGKKQVWRPRGRTWGLWEANVLYWRKYLWYCWEFSGAPAVIRRPGSCSPLAPPSLRPWLTLPFTYRQLVICFLDKGHVTKMKLNWKFCSSVGFCYLNTDGFE